MCGPWRPEKREEPGFGPSIRAVVVNYGSMALLGVELTITCFPLAVTLLIDQDPCCMQTTCVLREI